MRRRRGRKKAGATAMLELWRPPDGAGDPIGCLTTTYTFTPGLFDEQCLARFLEIESAPDREDLPFLLERESRLGSVYAGVLVDHTNAGQEHSLRWDVLPVRLPRGKQHAKISLLAWARCVRIIVASANLSEAGYRTNREVASAVELKPEHADLTMLADVVGFLRRLLRFVPGSEGDLPVAQRARDFLTRVENRTGDWKPLRRHGNVRRHVVFTLPEGPATEEGASSLEDAVALSRKRGPSPDEAWVASPFFDLDDDASPLTAALCKHLTRKGTRSVTFCVPEIRGDDAPDVPRLAAPRGLILTPPRYDTEVAIEALPNQDPDRNLRPWHAKMLALQSNAYSALMIGSSNFTRAGMGVGPYRNAEANLLTIVDRVRFGREDGLLEAIWSEMEPHRGSRERGMGGGASGARRGNGRSAAATGRVPGRDIPRGGASTDRCPARLHAPAGPLGDTHLWTEGTAADRRCRLAGAGMPAGDRTRMGAGRATRQAARPLGGEGGVSPAQCGGRARAA